MKEPIMREIVFSRETTRGATIESAGGVMNATQELHNLGQSLWLDNITRDLLENGTLKRYIDEFSLTGLYVESNHL
jgi:hypothetical protein